jgi:RNA polymerase sigma-70 factor (ECF subfamily)
MKISDDGKIVAEVLEGNRNAFGILVRKYQKQVFTLMHRFTNSSSEAADLTQEAFLKAYNRLETFQPGKKFFVWLYTLSLNLARDYGRKNKKYAENLTENIIDDAHREAHDQEKRLIQKGEIMALLEALYRLPEDFREALILRYREDLPMKDIARILNLSVSGAKMRIHRGLIKLRELVTEDGNEKDF